MSRIEFVREYVMAKPHGAFLRPSNIPKSRTAVLMALSRMVKENGPLVRVELNSSIKTLYYESNFWGSVQFSVEPFLFWFTRSRVSGIVANMNQSPRSKTAVISGFIALTLLLAGCATFNSTGRSGMMNSSSRYYSSQLTCSVPENLPGQIINVELGDMGMTRMMGGVAPRNSQMRLVANPTTFSAGKVTIVVSNLGWRTHELVVLPLGQGTTAGNRIPNAEGEINETGSLGEASNNCAEGSGEGIDSGGISWVTLTLAVGRYEFLCNLTNHYANGMWQEVVVTA